MSEETKKVETIVLYPSELPEGQEDIDYLCYGVQGVNINGERTRANVCYMIPKTDEESVERYNCTLDDLVVMGVRAGVATRPNYPLEFQGRTTDSEGKLIDKGIVTQAVVDACQALADAYKVGMKKVSKETTITKAVKNSGLTTEEAMEALRLYVASKNA